MKQEPASKRIVEQRLRNRIMEALLSIAEGDEGVREAGFVEYFEGFFDVVSDDALDNSALASEEKAALRHVLEQINEACEQTPNRMSDDEFIATGWPARLRPIAQEALASMLDRGRFSEEAEELMPSKSDGWPWTDSWKGLTTS